MARNIVRPNARRALCAMLALTMTFAVITGAGNAGAATPVPTCTSGVVGCAPPALLDPDLLANSASAFSATPSQRTSLEALEQQAVANTIQDHDLTASDAAAVLSWGRPDAEAQLFALVLQAIQTDPAQRSADQQNTVDWMTSVLQRKAAAEADDAGWQYLKWAGALPGDQPMPPADQIVSLLDAYARPVGQNPRQPIPFNTDPTKSTPTSGYCVYRSPQPLPDEYQGYAGGGTASQVCVPPYQCTSPFGCDDDAPSYDQFVEWGEADSDSGNRQLYSDSYAAETDSDEEALAFGGVAAASGVTSVELAATLGPAISGTQLVKAIWPYLTRSFATWADVSGDLAEALAGGLAAGALLFALNVAVLAITTAVLEGIRVADEANLPGKLSSLVSNAQSASPDLHAMLGDSDQLAGLFGVFVAAAGPAPSPTVCDNSNHVLPVYGPAPTPCLNAPPIPAPGPNDPQFVVTPRDSSSAYAVHSDTLDWVDGYGYGGSPDSILDLAVQITAFSDSARLAGTWFVGQQTSQDGTYTTPVMQRLLIHYLNWQDQMSVAWLVRLTDGSFKWLTYTGAPIFRPDQEGTLDPSTCEQPNAPIPQCAYTDTLQMIQRGSDGADHAVTVGVVPAHRAAPAITGTTLPDARAGSPYYLPNAPAHAPVIAASATGTGPISYAITSGTLPTGLSLNPATAAISGTTTTAGDYPITVTAGNALGSDSVAETLHVDPADATARLGITPQVARTTAGVAQPYSVTGYDQYGNSQGDITTRATLSIDGGTCTNTACSSTIAGDHAVTATLGGATGKATLQVAAGTPVSISPDPATATVPAGQVQRYAVTGTDAYGNQIKYRVESLTIAPVSGGSDAGAACGPVGCSATRAGTYQVEVTFDWYGQPQTADAQLVVTRAALTTLTLSPASASIAAGSNQAYTVTASDDYGNTLDLTGLPLHIAPVSGGSPTGASCAASACTAQDAGQYAVETDLAVPNPVTHLPLVTTARLTVHHAREVKITATAGDRQTGRARTRFAHPLTATVTDAFGNPVPGVPVTFTVRSGSAHFTHGTALTVRTGSDGTATAPLTAGAKAGPVAITATTDGRSTMFLEAVTAPAGRANLTVDLSVPTTLPAGGRAAITVTVTNHGPDAAAAFLTDIALPRGIVAAALSGATRYGPDVVVARSGLHAGRRVTYKVNADVRARPGTVLTFQARAISATRDPHNSNNTASSTTIVTHG